ELVSKHIHERPLGLRAIAPTLNVPEQLDSLVLKALEKECSQRFQSASEVSEALRFLEPGSSRAGGKAMAGPPVAPWLKKSIAAFAGFLLVVVLLGLDVYVANWYRNTEQGQIQSLQMQVLYIEATGPVGDFRLIDPLSKLCEQYRQQGRWIEAK